MLWLTFALFVCLTQTSPGSQKQTASPPEKAVATQSTNTVNPAGDEVQEVAKKLLQVKRIYVENFGDDLVSKQIHAMVISSLSESKRFIVTENKEKADAILKGAALEKTSQ